MDESAAVVLNSFCLGDGALEGTGFENLDFEVDVGRVLELAPDLVGQVFPEFSGGAGCCGWVTFDADSGAVHALAASAW